MENFFLSLMNDPKQDDDKGPMNDIMNGDNNEYSKYMEDQNF